jgi:hypothetical protein
MRVRFPGRYGWFLIAGAGLASMGCGGGYVEAAPPPARVEVIERPGPRHVWVDGVYRYRGGNYVWVPGRWVVPPRSRSAWVPGRWVHTPRGWRYVDGHWR